MKMMTMCLCVMCALSAFAEYILMSPAECYEPFMAVMMSKIQLSKLVIEFLTESPDASYEDLLNHLQTAAPVKGQTASFSEDDLLRHSQWIVDQVFSVSVCFLCCRSSIQWFDAFGQMLGWMCGECNLHLTYYLLTLLWMVNVWKLNTCYHCTSYHVTGYPFYCCLAILNRSGVDISSPFNVYIYFDIYTV